MTTATHYTERLDGSVRPQDDFFAYVNGKWLAANPIPDDETSWGNFSVLHDQAQKHMHQIFEELKPGTFADGSIEQQIRDFYISGINFDQHKDDNLAALDQYFTRIDSATDQTGLSKVIAKLHRAGLSSPWNIVIDADDRDSTSHLMRITQPRLTLPDRDYYLDKSEKMQHIRQEYQKFARKMYSYFPTLAASEDDFWNTIWQIELKIAKVNRSRIALRDIQSNYHPIDIHQLIETYQNINWLAYAQDLKWPTSSKISNDQPEVLASINQLLAEHHVDEWRTYLKWSLLTMYSGKISNELSEVRFEFVGKVLGGAKENLPLWKRVVTTIDQSIGEAAGQLYAKRHFPESSKKQVLSIVEDIREAYRQRILGLDWMSDPTKQTALKKLSNIKVLIGYPDKWRDYSQLKISPTSYLSNAMAAEELDADYWLGKLLQPTSRDDWFMYPQTVNAYHDPNRLVICFPAAILQPPFFSPDAPYAANLGAIGAVIGHEFTHGFDDQGCQFDEFGNVRTWQTEEERQAFAERAQKIIDQADQFEVLPDVHLKGQLVIGESIADLGGVELAHHALLNRIKDANQAVSDGLTHEQIFFISFASTECGHTREERKRELAVRDPHPAEKFRVNAVLAHCQAFYQAYNVKKGDALYRPPEQRAKIW